jgi:hypothetical protein
MWENWDWDWFNFNWSLPANTPYPTAEPTFIHDCDPHDPPCAKYELGICTEYETCFGVHSTPHNTTKEQFNDDEGYTFEPTHMPVPHPTPAPSEYPTSTPTTSAPTPVGYTFTPTISMMPSAVATHGPTSYVYCNPEAPPCDHYFFGGCLGVRYCYGSHFPTPSPTSVPVADNDDLVVNNSSKHVEEEEEEEEEEGGGGGGEKSEEEESESKKSKSRTSLKSRKPESKSKSSKSKSKK